MSVTDLKRAREDTGWPEGEEAPGGRSAAERAADGEGLGEGEQAEMFPLGSISGDPKRTHKTMIPAGTSVKIEAKLSNASVPMTDGLYAFGDHGELLITFEAGKLEQVPELGEEKSDGTRKLEGVKLVQRLRVIHTRDGSGMFTHEQVVELLEAGGVKPAKIASLLGLEG